MTLFNFNKKKEPPLQKDVPLQESSSPKIDIIIESSNNLYENEQEMILAGARVLLENRRVDNFEDGIITFATMFRGLRYKGIEKDDDGSVKILLSDMSLENVGRFH